MARAILALVGVLLLSQAAPASALKPHERGGWAFGLGFGVGAGDIRTVTGDDDRWDEAVIPQLRLIKNFGNHWGVGFEHHNWFYEFGTEGEVEQALKIRTAMQTFTLSLSWYPGNPQNAWGGLFFRAGFGPALANLALAIPEPGNPEEETQLRQDEWGWGVNIGVGYEFRLTRSFAAGFFISGDYLSISDHSGSDLQFGQQIFDEGRFGSTALHFLWYF
jgi:hypothetical protein